VAVELRLRHRDRVGSYDELLPPPLELLELLSGMTACTVPTTAPAAVAATCVTFSATLPAIWPIVLAFWRAFFIIRRACAGAFFAMLRPVAAALRIRFMAPPELRFDDDLRVDFVDLFDPDFAFDADFFDPDDPDLLADLPDDLRVDFFAPDDFFEPRLPLFFAMRTLL